MKRTSVTSGVQSFRRLRIDLGVRRCAVGVAVLALGISANAATPPHPSTASTAAAASTPVVVHNPSNHFGQDGAKGDRFGAAVARHGDLVVAGAPADWIGDIDDAGGAYVFARGPGGWSLQQKLIASDASDFSMFGTAVALRPDVIFVGAPNASTSVLDYRGAVYVFRRQGSLWIQSAKLMAADTRAGDAFGSSLQLDGETLIIGAPRHNVGTLTDAGAAYIFDCPADAPCSERQKLTAVDAATRDRFGTTVAIEGGLAAVAATRDDVNGVTDQGSIHVYSRSGLTWLPQQQLFRALPPPAGVSSDFGISIAIDGDRLIAGTTTDSYYRPGLVTIYALNNGVWAASQVISAPGPDGYDTFGRAVAVSASRLFVGTPELDLDRGAVFEYRYIGGAWQGAGRIERNGPVTRDPFGFALDAADDSLLVGFGRDAIGVTDRGEAQLFDLSGATPTFVANFDPGRGGTSDSFGCTVAAQNDLIVAGACYDTPRDLDQEGSLYVYERTPGGWTRYQQLIAEPNTALANVGSSVAISGPTIVAGNGQSRRAYIFTRRGSSFEQSQVLESDGAPQFGQFGKLVAMDGDTLLVNEPYANAEFAGDGVVHVYEREGLNWRRVQVLADAQSGLGDQFGTALAIDAGRIVVRAERSNSPNVPLPVLVVFEKSAGGWNRTATVAPPLALEPEFGTRIALDDERMLVSSVGAQGSDRLAHVFERQVDGTWQLRQTLNSLEFDFFERYVSSVALNGELAVVNDVGYDDAYGLSHGRSRIFRLRDGQWQFDQRIEPVALSSGYLGYSVALTNERIALGLAAARTQDEFANPSTGAFYVFENFASELFSNGFE